MPRKKKRLPSSVGKHGSIPTGGDEATQTIAILRRAVVKGWDIPQQVMDAIPRIAAGIALSKETDSRDKLRAIEVVQRLIRDRWEAAIELDRINRLDRGDATERLEIGSTITQEQLNAVADFLESRGKIGG
jgi:hypothetical protein